MLNLRLCVCVLVCFAGLLDAEPLRESEEDNMVSDVDLNNTVTEEGREEIQQELAKV